MFAFGDKHKRVRALLSPYLDNELKEDERELVDRHLAACEPCRREMQGLRATVALLKVTPVASPSRSFLVQAEKKPRPRPAPPLWQPVPVPVIISLLLTLALFLGDILNALPYSPERTESLAPPSLTSPITVPEESPDAAAVIAQPPSLATESPVTSKPGPDTSEAPRAKALTGEKAPAAADAGGAVSPPAQLRAAPSTTEAGGEAVQAPPASPRPVPQLAPTPQPAPFSAPSASAAPAPQPVPAIPLPQATVSPTSPSQTPMPEMKIGKPPAEGVPSPSVEQATATQLPAAGPEGNFFVMPWRLIEVGLVILSTVVIAVTILIRKRRRKEINSF